MLSRVLEPELMDTASEAIAYDAMDHAEVNRQFVTDLLGFADELLANAPSYDSECGGAAFDPEWIEILDLGTGTAQQPIELCGRCERVRVLAADAAENMLDVARNNVEMALLTDRIMLDLVDAKSLPYEDGRFQIVVSNSIVHHIPEPLLVLQEAVRVAAPGAIVFFRDLLRPESTAELDHLVETYADGATEHQRMMFTDSLRAALSLEEIRGLVERIGFSRDSVCATSDRHWTWAAKGE